MHNVTKSLNSDLTNSDYKYWINYIYQCNFIYNFNIYIIIRISRITIPIIIMP